MISIFTSVTDPIRRGEHYNESIRCYRDLADEVVVVNGGGQITNHLGVKYVNHKWPEEFKWDFIGQQFTRGYKACTGDWVLHMDLDWLFHERDFDAVRQTLISNPDTPAMTFYKWQFLTPDKYNLKSRLVVAVNKKIYGDRIKFNGGGDLCQPTLDGLDLTVEDMPEARMNFYNYEKLFKTKEQVLDDVGRMDRAFFNLHEAYQYGVDGSNESAYEGWLRMMLGRLNKPHKAINISEHPRYIQEALKNLKPEQWGYNGFNNLGVNNYAS